MLIFFRMICEYMLDLCYTIRPKKYNSHTGSLQTVRGRNSKGRVVYYDRRNV